MFARLGPRGRIFNISETAEGERPYELTPEQLAIIGSEPGPKDYFIINGNLLTIEEAQPLLERMEPMTPNITIKAWQAKAILKQMPSPVAGHASMLETAEAIINGISDPIQRLVVQTAWEHEADFPRQSQTINALAAAIPLTDEQLDQMYAAGAALSI